MYITALVSPAFFFVPLNVMTHKVATYIKPQWQNAIHWLQNEIERPPFDPGLDSCYLFQRPYVSTARQAMHMLDGQFNEASNGYACY